MSYIDMLPNMGSGLLFLVDHAMLVIHIITFMVAIHLYNESNDEDKAESGKPALVLLAFSLLWTVSALWRIYT